MKTMTRWTILVALLLLTASACTEEEPSGADAPAADTDDAAETAQNLAQSFVPAADQFGVEQFKIVYDLEGQESGTRTMWVENYGERVGIEDNLTAFGQRRHSLYYWDGERSYMQDLPDGEVSSTPIRTKVSEPTSFATTPAGSLEQVGYTRLGEKTLVGQPCEHWKNEQFNYEGCRWKNIELEFLNGAGTERILQRSLATAFVDGEGIPDRLKALAQ